ncbi:MAG: hypothetical protein WA733_10580 [Methylocystis sp.]
MEHKGPGKPVARPPALAPLVVESSPGPIASEPVTIFRGPGRRVAKAPTFNAPRPALADRYSDDDLPPAA